MATITGLTAERLLKRESVLQMDLAADIPPFNSPGMYTVWSGSFIPELDFADVDVQVAASYMGGAVGHGNVGFYHSQSAAPPLNPRNQELGVSPGVTLTIIGAISAQASTGHASRRFRITGLTPGVECRWELGFAIVGYLNQIDLPEVPYQVDVSAPLTNSTRLLEHSTPMKLQDNIIACVGPTKLMILRSNHIASPAEDHITSVSTTLAGASQQRTCGITPDGKKVAVSNSTDGSVSVYNITNSSAPALQGTYDLPGADVAVNCAVNPAGTEAWCPSMGSGKVYIVNLATGAITTLDTGASSQPVQVVFSPDGTKAGVACYGTSKYKTYTAATRTLLADGDISAVPPVLCGAFDPTSTYVYVCGARKMLRMHATTGALDDAGATIANASFNISDMVVFKDGFSALVVGGGDQKEVMHVNLPDRSKYSEWTNYRIGAGAAHEPVSVALNHLGSIYIPTLTGLNIWYGGQIELRAATAELFDGVYAQVSVDGATAV